MEKVTEARFTRRMRAGCECQGHIIRPARPGGDMLDQLASVVGNRFPPPLATVTFPGMRKKTNAEFLKICDAWGVRFAEVSPVFVCTWCECPFDQGRCVELPTGDEPMQICGECITRLVSLFVGRRRQP